MAEFEWMIILLLGLALLVYELISVRRSIRRARDEPPQTGRRWGAGLAGREGPSRNAER